MATPVWKDPVVLEQAAVLWRRGRDRRLAREAAHGAGDHRLCVRDIDTCRADDARSGPEARAS